MSVTLLDWLGARTPAEIARTLTLRPDATAPPTPRNRRDLADRLEMFSSVSAAVHTLPTPGLQVIEVLQLLGPDGGESAALAGWLGRHAADPELESVLARLADLALVWPDRERLVMAEPLYATFLRPLKLGPPAATVLTTCAADDLRRIMRTLGLPAKSRKDAMVASIATVLEDTERVRELVASAPPAARKALTELAEQGPPVSQEGWYGFYRRPVDPQLRWSQERGLVVAPAASAPEVPREVAVALRGPDWHAPFTPARPEPPLTDVDGAAVRREAAATGTAAVEQVTALLEAAAATPVAALKAGGVGVKELRRLAKTVGTDEGTARLWLELAFQAGLLAPANHKEQTVLLPSRAYDEWAAAEPANRLASLLVEWTGLTAYPALAPAGDEKPPPALTDDHSGHVLAVARQHLLALLLPVPAGRAVTPARAGLVASVTWQAPLTLAPLPDLDRFLAAAWQEAEKLGVIAHGTLTPLGRALLTGPEALGDACRELLPPAVDEAVFQTDLTALVPGTPATPLATLLDTAADRETRGGAVTWRFNAGSVRRALDRGFDADALLAALQERATGGVLPQPLRYLVTDVARRHGAIRVREVACVLRAEDPALLAEIARTRALAPLGLSVIAETVVGSAKPLRETLAALRAAGYAPVAESADGATQLERVAPRRAGQVGGDRRRPAGPDPADLDPADPDPAELDLEELARRLLAAPVPPERLRPAAGSRADPRRGAFALPDGEDLLVLPGQEDDLDAELDLLAGHLSAGERRLLAHAIEHSSAVAIAYSNAQGNPSQRVIEPLELAGSHVIAWCHLRDDERQFALHRITSVAPA